MRTREGPAVHDNGIYNAGGCPRGRSDCDALARYASPGAESFMCCGETAAAPVPRGVDLMVHLDERDAVHTASVLLAGLSALGSVAITATDQLDAARQGTADA